MALTVTNAGTGVSTTNNTTLTITNVTAAVGDWLVVFVAAANAGTNGAAPTITISDGNNTYVDRGIDNYDPGAASEGATLGKFTAEITSALSNATVTITFGVNVPQKAAVAYKVVPDAGEMVVYREVGTTASGSRTSHSATAISVTNGDTVFGASSIETDDTITGDSDTTNGNWSTVYTALGDGGLDAAAMSCSAQWKTVNATASQNWACSTANARDSISNTLVLYPQVIPPTQAIVTFAEIEFAEAEASSWPATATLSASLSTTQAASVIWARTATLATTASLSATGGGLRPRTSAISMAASLAGSGGGLRPRTAAISAAATIAGEAVLVYLRTAALSMAASFAAVAQAFRPRSAALAATASVAASSGALRPRTAALSIAATVVASGGGLRPRTAAISASATLSADGTSFISRSAAIVATATVVAAGGALRHGTAAITAAASVVSAATGNRARTSSLTTAATLVVAAGAYRSCAASLATAVTLSADAARTRVASASLAATTSLVVTANRYFSYFASPGSTISSNGWTTDLGGADLHTAVDETSANDADYIQSPASPAGEACEIAFSMPTPEAWPARVRYRAKADASYTLTVRLMEGAAQRASWVQLLAADYTDYEETLTEPEFNSVTDWSNVRLRFEAG